MKIKELINEMEYEILAGSEETEITTLVYDSRKVEKGSVFVCISGSVRDAHEFIPDVAAKGAAAIVVEKDVTPIDGITYIKVEDSRLALACMSAAYFGHPAKKLKTIGITGTKGKTTTTYMVRSILESAGIKTGLIGTIESIVGSERIPSANTTPESYRVQELFAKMVDAGLDAVVMEVSSQALMLHRVSGFVFDIGVFTNLEPDHIGENEHKDFADYMHCKSLLFQQCRHGIFNGDSEHLQGILQGHTCTVETFGYGAENDLIAQKVELKKEHGALGVKYHVGGSMDFDVEVNVPGKFSVYNALNTIAVGLALGISLDDCAKAMKTAHGVKGRMELVPTDGDYTIVIDYAHTPDALENVLTAINEIVRGKAQVITVCGAGGNRDKGKRPLMAQEAAKRSDRVIITSDNPRFENPQDIINDMLAGLDEEQKAKTLSICDRREAIRTAGMLAQPGDVILVAGKGHEPYQDVQGVKHHFDDHEEVRRAFGLEA